MQPACGHEMLEVEIVLMIALVHSQPPQHFNAAHQGIFFSALWFLKFGKCFQFFIKILNLHVFLFQFLFVATVQKFAQKQNSVYLQELPIYVMVMMCLEPSPLGAPYTHMEFLTNCPHTSNSQTSLESRQGTG